MCIIFFKNSALFYFIIFIVVHFGLCDVIVLLPEG